jgi:hypothetical protein
MSLREHQVNATQQSVKVAPFLAFWRAKVTAYDRAFFQVTAPMQETPVFPSYSNATVAADKRRRCSVFAAAGKKLLVEKSVRRFAHFAVAVMFDSLLAATEKMHRTRWTSEKMHRTK